MMKNQKNLKKQAKPKNSVSYMQSLPIDIFEELSELCKLYELQNTLKINKLSLQDLVRLILKSHLQALRGPTEVERLRASEESIARFIKGPCPRCLLRVDKRNYPALVVENSTTVRCHICGTSLPLQEVFEENDW